MEAYSLNHEDIKNNFIIILLIMMIISNAFVLRAILNPGQPVINVSVPPETPISQVENKNSPYILSSSGENLWVMNSETRVIKLFKIAKNNYGEQVIEEVTAYQFSR